MNKILVEGQKGHGALKKKKDLRDKQWHRIARDSEPFDWSKGYDVEVEKGFKQETKDQGPSGSCSGQSYAYYCEAQNSNPRSAKYAYSQIFAPGGGSDMRSILNLGIKKGDCFENLVPSVPFGGVEPNEFFMEDQSENTPEADLNASETKGVGYALVQPDIDLYAQAIRDNRGCITELRGYNNGTWLSAFPKPPNGINEKILWGHFIYCGKAKLINGAKFVGVHNSWGNDCGESGWQWLSEDYFKSGFIYEGGVIYAKGNAIINEKLSLLQQALGLAQQLYNLLTNNLTKRLGQTNIMQNSTSGTLNAQDLGHIGRHLGWVALAAVVTDALSVVIPGLPHLTGWQGVTLTFVVTILVGLKSLITNYSTQ